MTSVGIPLLDDIEKAKTLPILNLPAGCKRIRIRHDPRYPIVYFNLRFRDGVGSYVGTLRGTGIELIEISGGKAYTRPNGTDDTDSSSS